MTKIPGIKAVHAIITPTCRVNRGDDGALVEALVRVRDGYSEVVAARTDEYTAHVVLSIADETQSVPKGPKSSTGSEFSQTPTSLETGGRNALNLQMALEGAEAFIGVMFGDENGDVPSTVVTPLGIPVKIGDIMREIREALQDARAASDGKEQGNI